ncbi:hypothetical protein K2173_015444 [Erythroxylum novogranatense]|uniref:non-specific serine/threonine protein kinase n=1 Tax=Erythroxylum novogranatense TaxID=1862640 RepID=A0AAV8SRN1_9ROSI|nr:hypothetical protein K2173_015444 [Erythroxylum novogranatense]
MPPRKLLVFLFCFTLFTTFTHSFLALAYDVSFDFSSLNLRDLIVLEDSDVTIPSSSSGTVIYDNPVYFLNPASNATASFSTMFTFSISNGNPSSYGDGLAFFFSQDNEILDRPGGYLGLVNSSLLTENKFVAVEFDTRLDAHFSDPNDRHCGVDIDSLESIETADPLLQNVDLKSGDWIMAWINFKNDLRVLKVFMSNSSWKPEKALLTVDIDLSVYLKGIMYVSFPGSSEGSTEVHFIHSWSFHTYEFLPVRPNSHPYDMSDISVSVTTVISLSHSISKHHKRLGLGLGIVGLAFLCTFLVVLGYISVKRWQKTKFTYKEMSLATRGFHSSKIIGNGAFGNVYKAFFYSSGTFAVVKRSKHSHEGKTKFLSELSIIAYLRHKNLIPLLGWCVEKGELLLVYEFMLHGSLDTKNIAFGLASGLTYLHQECEQQVIHRDIKASNVMLDVNFSARLGDFGLARIMDHDRSPVSTLTARTMGYLAPEYLHVGKATMKTDVFSYGVVMLKVAYGRRSIERESRNIIEAANKILNGEFNEAEMRTLLLIGLSLLQILRGETEPIVVPKQKPSLTFSRGMSLNLEK